MTDGATIVEVCVSDDHPPSDAAVDRSHSVDEDQSNEVDTATHKVDATDSKEVQQHSIVVQRENKIQDEKEVTVAKETKSMVEMHCADVSVVGETPTASGDSFNNVQLKTDHVETKNNLIVNYLPPNMTQDEVRALFSSIGEVESCKLVRDKVTGESLGYAFVKFVNHNDGERAVNTLNGLRLQNKTIKVSFARPSSESIKNANLYICGLPKKMNQTELETLFSQCGKIITARILYDNKTGLSRGVAFIRFDQRHEAEAAISRFHDSKLENSVESLTVKFANSPAAVTTRQDSPSVASLIKQNAHLHASANHASQNILQQLSGALSRFRYPTASSVGELELLGSNPLLTQAMVAASGGLTNKGWCLFVCNLAPETVEAEMWKLFGPFGAVQSVKLMRDTKTQRCKGFGFVTMTNFEEAMYAVLSLKDFEHNNRRLQVSFKTEGGAKLRPFSLS